MHSWGECRSKLGTTAQSGPSVIDGEEKQHPDGADVIEEADLLLVRR
jgi:hypothetical protein